MNIKGKAVVTNLNIGKQGSEDEQEVRLDIKLHFDSLSAECLVPLLGASSYKQVKAMWEKNGNNHDFMYIALGSMDTQESYVDNHTLKVGRSRALPASKVQKISFRPSGNFLTSLTLSVSVLEPEEKFIEVMIDNISKECSVEITQDQMDLLDGNALKVNWIDYMPDEQNVGAWMNPPYSDPTKWCRKAWLESMCGLIVVGLLPDDRSTEWYQKFIEDKASVVFVPNKRISFINPVTGKPQGGNPKGSVIPIWTPWQTGRPEYIRVSL